MALYRALYCLAYRSLHGPSPGRPPRAPQRGPPAHKAGPAPGPANEGIDRQGNIMPCIRPYLIPIGYNIKYLLRLVIFLWIGSPNPWLRLNRWPQALFLFYKDTFVFVKVCFGVPKPCLCLNRLPQTFFCF